ncbi:MAG: hypothetical protein AAF462_03365 [Thermodesulfobacteriota bacterium]
MKHTIMVFALMLVIAACSNNSGTNNNDSQINCFTKQEVSMSDCPAELLTNICSTYTCHSSIGNIAVDSIYPPCAAGPLSCQFVDCSTLICGQSINYDITINEDGLNYSFDTTDPMTGEPIEVRVTCLQEGFLSFDCGPEGLITPNDIY